MGVVTEGVFTLIQRLGSVVTQNIYSIGLRTFLEAEVELSNS